MLWSCESSPAYILDWYLSALSLPFVFKYYIGKHRPLRDLWFIPSSGHFSSCFWVILPLSLCLGRFFFFFLPLFKQGLILPLVELGCFTWIGDYKAFLSGCSAMNSLFNFIFFLIYIFYNLFCNKWWNIMSTLFQSIVNSLSILPSCLLWAQLTKPGEPF